VDAEHPGQDGGGQVGGQLEHAAIGGKGTSTWLFLGVSPPATRATAYG